MNKIAQLEINKAGRETGFSESTICPHPKILKLYLPLPVCSLALSPSPSLSSVHFSIKASPIPLGGGPGVGSLAWSWWQGLLWGFFPVCEEHRGPPPCSQWSPARATQASFRLVTEWGPGCVSKSTAQLKQCSQRPVPPCM